MPKKSKWWSDYILFCIFEKKYIMKKSNANFLKSQIKWTGLACTYVQHKLIDKCWKLLQTLIAIFLHFDTVITESFTYRRFAWPFNLLFDVASLANSFCHSLCCGLGAWLYCFTAWLTFPCYCGCCCCSPCTW